MYKVTAVYSKECGTVLTKQFYIKAEKINSDFCGGFSVSQELYVIQSQSTICNNTYTPSGLIRVCVVGQLFITVL